MGYVVTMIQGTGAFPYAIFKNSSTGKTCQYPCVVETNKFTSLLSIAGLKFEGDVRLSNITQIEIENGINNPSDVDLLISEHAVTTKSRYLYINGVGLTMEQNTTDSASEYKYVPAAYEITIGVDVSTS
jgi:hypothetical protein